MKRIYPVFLLALVLLADSCNNSCNTSQPRLRKVYTEHLGQLTGTTLNSAQNFGITGTDLGVSFADPSSPDHIIFLFGDTWTRDDARRDQDSTAFASTFTIPERFKMPTLNWVRGGLGTAGQFTNVNIPGVSLGGFEVPVEGVFAGGQIYIFATTGWDEEARRHSKSVLARTSGAVYEPDKLIKVDVRDSDKFLNISAFNESGTVWIFGSGSYRKSPVYLARVPEAELGMRDNWQYFQTMANGVPKFGPGEESAAPIVISFCVGELSVRKHPELGYLMLYNCGDEDGTDGKVPRGIHLRHADQPWGPWDAPISIFDPGKDEGYGHFMHQKITPSFGDPGPNDLVPGVYYDDGLAEPGRHNNVKPECTLKAALCCEYGLREECWGGEYGPYLVPQWFTKTADGDYSIVYTLSTWVPYQVHLMRTVLAKGEDPNPQLRQRPPQRVQNLHPTKLTNGDFGGTGECSVAGWRSLGDAFRVFKGDNGQCYVTTFTLAKGVDATGALAQEFTVDANIKALRFKVHGGEATVRLQQNSEILRETRGRSGHEPRNSPETVVCWNISEYAGETLTLAIFDGKTGPWGFIGVRGFDFLNTPC
jgi:Domain of unknown function (DUF4185)